jgi:hypothetical protein
VRGALYPPSVGAQGKRAQAAVMITPEGLDGIYNPSFDVTPAELITAIVTEKGVAVKGSDGKFDLSNVPPSGSPFSRSPPSLVTFVRPACALVAGDEEGIWPHPPSHPRSPSFVLVRPCSPLFVLVCPCLSSFALACW